MSINLLQDILDTACPGFLVITGKKLIIQCTLTTAHPSSFHDCQKIDFIVGMAKGLIIS